jgi:hypothetical protein
MRSSNYINGWSKPMSRTYSPKTAPIYQFKISLDGITPPIWRRFLVSSNIPLSRLHDTLQTIMGWTNSHLHMFEIYGQVFGDPQDDEYGDMGTLNETDYRLRKIVAHEGQQFQYEYDFGDGWRHTLLLEKILPPDPAMHLPVCLQGKRACPPEDVGGIGGYDNFLEAIRDPEHEEHDEYLTWWGGKFNPNKFDLELVNQGLRKIKNAPDAWQMDEYPSYPVEKKRPAPQPPALDEEQRQAVEALPLRRDVLTLLNYLRTNRVTGTQSSGNLTLKAIRAVCAQFVVPPELETSIGKHVFHVRSESEVWPLYFVHVLASVGGLVMGGPGRRWLVTPLGEKFLEVPAELQVWLLFITWWKKVNWGIAWSSLPDEFPPAHLRKIILECLLSLPVGQSLPHNHFADRVLEASRLIWPHGNGSHESSILHGLIESTVAEPLDRLGVLALEYGPHPTWGERFHELHSLTLTALGKSLLGCMKE